MSIPNDSRPNEWSPAVTRCILFLGLTLPAVGCCSMDPCTGAWQCCEPITGTSAGFRGFCGGCGGCGPARGATNGCGTCNSGCGLSTGFGLFDGRLELFDNCCAPACGPVVQPICDPCGGGGYPGYGPPAYGVPAYGTSYAPGPTTPAAIYTTPTLTAEPQFVPGAEVSPIVPPPDLYPTSVSPLPQATTPTPIRNTYSWRRDTRRS
jgi:hypothetical protein